MCCVNKDRVPQRSAWRRVVVRVEGVQALVLRCYDHDISFYAVDGQVCHPQRLRIYCPVDGAREELSESAARHVGSGEGIFTHVATVPGQIVMVGEDSRQVGHTDGDTEALCDISRARGCNRVDTRNGRSCIRYAGSRCAAHRVKRAAAISRAT